MRSTRARGGHASFVALVALGALTACGGGRGPATRPDAPLIESTAETRPLEGAVVFPAPPQDADLIRLRTSATASFEYAVDPRSIEVAREGIVRFTLVARSDSGASNVSYIGVRCAAREQRHYAFLRQGAEGSTWARSRSNEWRRLAATASADVVSGLSRDFLCPGGSPPASASDVVSALRAGITPGLISH